MSRQARWGSFVLAAAAVQVAVALLFKNSYGLTSFGDILQSSLLALATAGTLRNIRASHGPARKFWFFMAVGFSLWLAATLGWTWLEVFRHREAPNPFDGDVVLFIHVVPMLTALALWPHAPEQQSFSPLDFGLLLLWWLYLYLIFVIPWQYIELNIERYGYSFNLLYLAESAIFILASGLMWRRCSSAAWRPVYRNLFWAAGLYLVGSQAASLAIDKGVYYTGSLYDVPLVASMAWLACIAFLHPAGEMQKEPVKSASRDVLLWPTRVATIVVLSTPLLSVWILHSRETSERVEHFRFIVSLLALLSMSALLFFRQTLLDSKLLTLLNTSEESLNNLTRLQMQLVQSEKLAALGRLVAGTAHEINNPLTAIHGYAEILAAQTPESAGIGVKILEQTRRTESLVSDLLNFAEEHPTQRSLLRLDAILNSALKLKKPAFAEKNIQLQVESNAEVPLVSGDANQVLKVFLHLIENAIDALHEKGGGTLTVKTCLEGKLLAIEFIDNGPGIADPTKVFDPFYTTKPVGKGAGMGLSVCYGIVRAHHGELTCWNNVAGGATFRVAFPFG